MEPTASLVESFVLDEKFLSADRITTGHIHASYVVTTECLDGSRRQYVLQRLNRALAPTAELVIENTRRVTEHLARRMATEGLEQIWRRVPSLVCAGDKRWLLCDQAGECWRMFRRIPDARTLLVPRRVQDVEQAARAFGAFQRRLIDLPPPRLHETIPSFHDTPLRFQALDEAASRDVSGRVERARPELAYLKAHREFGGLLQELCRSGRIPERVVHNDAKISNVLFDASHAAGGGHASDEALCVIDFDTVMPGLSLFDFGDMMRSMICAAKEDESDLTRVEVDPAMFAGLARGYLAEMGGLLTPVEHEHMIAAGKIITLEQGVRFLTDYLQGDTYYRTTRPHQNLDRARVQIKLLESIERHERELRRVLK